MSRIWTAAALLVIATIGLLRVAPVELRLAQVACWFALGALLVRTLVARQEPTRGENALVTGALALAALAIIRYGRYECWQVFATLCGSSAVAPASWDLVLVSQDSPSHLERFSSASIRPPLYGLFALAANLFLVPAGELMRQTQNLMPYWSDPPALAAFLASNPQPALLRIVQAQQLVLWGSAVLFVCSAARIVPALSVASVVLALYDGGVLTHGYFAHLIDAKLLYLAALFVASAATLLAIARPTRGHLLLGAAACAALPLIRPQGLVALLLVGLIGLRFLWAQPRVSGASVQAVAVASAVFVGAASLPTIVTLAGQRVLQPSNIYAMSRIATALELASADDVAYLPDTFTKRYLTTMLAMRDAGSRPADMSSSIGRNQALAIQACGDVDREQLHKISCADAMNTVSNVVLGRHYPAYLGKIVLPALAKLAPLHIGGAAWLVPVSFALWAVLAAVLVFVAPWVALWGAAILALHGSLLLLLAMFAGAHSDYLLTSEPVLISALGLMLAAAARGRRSMTARLAIPETDDGTTGIPAAGLARDPIDSRTPSSDSPTETEERNLDTRAQDSTLRSITQFAIKAFIGAAVVAATILFLLGEITDRVRSIRVGGPQFWGKLEREIARAADPKADLPAEQRERLLRDLRVIVERWRPFLDVLGTELQKSPGRRECTDQR